MCIAINVNSNEIYLHEFGYNANSLIMLLFALICFGQIVINHFIYNSFQELLQRYL